jgi:nitroreductase
MKLVDIIRKRSSVRYYKNKRVPSGILLKILEAGRWGPSLATIQPSVFIVVSKKEIKNKVCEIVDKRLKKLGIGGRIVFMPTTMKAIRSAPLLIFIYNSGKFRNLISKFVKFVNVTKSNKYVKLAEQAEISAISAAIQNMILLIEEFRLGSCWLHMPLYCEQEINKLLGIKNKLIAILALGYPAEKGRRSARKSFSDLVRFIN